MAESAPASANVGGKEEKCSEVNERGKEEVRHDKETHGRSDEIDRNTPVDEVKGPNVFERVKEEAEAVVGSVLHKS
ncbi:unnamed protein product [Cuscuta campestris]|uniref:Uncharacterized protein n=2 Tax=Cuscuta sect. Cleistogrammica TaxID=1824901 RepID=A0A484NIC6_9ASTE|nr:hypothetical protein DM860_014371 [Cuscuta australis]VFR00167.1 unnamed protein product [Cuscuta campestris]